FSVNFDRSVEVIFRPNRAVRSIEVRDFCVGGPQVTPHVVVQQLIPAGERREVSPQLDEGRHRLRTQALQGGQSVLVVADGAQSLTLRADGAEWPDNEPRIST